MRYLGNKTRMIDNISNFIAELQIDGKIFCDLFTGSASVADHFKDKYQIIANDLLSSSYTFATAKINFSKRVSTYRQIINIFTVVPELIFIIPTEIIHSKFGNPFLYFFVKFFRLIGISLNICRK